MSIKKCLVQIRDCLSNFCDRYLYSIPVVMGALFIVMVSVLFYSTLTAVNEMNNTIKSIPVIVQSEMYKTREVLKQEGTSSRATIVDQHEATRDELLQKLDAAEVERKRTQAALAKIERKVQEKPAPPKRQKILGVF